MASDHNSKLPHKNAWLQQIADGLKRNFLARTGANEVGLVDKHNEIEYTFELATFIDYIANEVYWDERGDWSQISELSLRVI